MAAKPARRDVEEPPPADGTALLRKLERKVESILDGEMRSLVVRETLDSAEAQEAVRALSLLFSGPHRDRPARILLREGVVELLGDKAGHGPVRPLSYGRRRELYEIASQSGNEAAMDLLRSRARASEEEPAAVRVPKDLEEISLGMRRSLAKQDDRHRLDQLCRDPDPIVIRHLLRNPRLREQDVVRIAAMRPVPESTLLEVSRSPRWARQPRIRAALARNPYTPLELTTKLIASIPLTDLRAMRADPDLHPEVLRRVDRQLRNNAVPPSDD